MANTVFENKVIEARAKNLLTTAINTRSLMTVDTSLAENAGMIKTINVYTVNGKAEELAPGAGNSTHGGLTYVGKDYTAKLVQAHFAYQDEDFMKDNTVVDTLMKGANQIMVNKFNADFFAECAKTETAKPFTGKISYDAIVDGISTLNVEDESKLFIIIPNAWKADLRKDPDYKAARMGEVVYNGQVGTVAGLPVIATNALKDAAYVMDNTAITLFLKKDIEVEQERDADTRTNDIFERAVYICALTDNSKCCKLSVGA